MDSDSDSETPTRSWKNERKRSAVNPPLSHSSDVDLRAMTETIRELVKSRPDLEKVNLTGNTCKSYHGVPKVAAPFL